MSLGLIPLSEHKDRPKMDPAETLSFIIGNQNLIQEHFHLRPLKALKQEVRLRCDSFPLAASVHV